MRDVPDMQQVPTQSSTHAMQVDISDLTRPQAYPHTTGKIELRETHISWVVLTGPYAYKIKKPVKFDFIDASTLEQRRLYCEEELRLNRRLAPELYKDVARITRIGGRAAVSRDGPVIDYAVRMQQFPSSDELPTLLARNEVSTAEISALGESLASFHMAAAVSSPTRSQERTEQMFNAVLGNLAQLITHIGSIDPSLGLGHLIDWTHDNARLLEPVLQQRERAGFVREVTATCMRRTSCGITADSYRSTASSSIRSCAGSMS